MQRCRPTRRDALTLPAAENESTSARTAPTSRASLEADRGQGGNDFLRLQADGDDLASAPIRWPGCA